MPEPPQVSPIRGLRLHFPTLEPWVVRSALFPTVRPGLSVHECGAAGSASGQTACPFHPTLHQSGSRHRHASPLCPGCSSRPLLPVWMNVYFLFPWCRTSLLFDFPSVLVVRGGAVCLPTPPSWFSIQTCYFNQKAFQNFFQPARMARSTEQRRKEYTQFTDRS